MGSALQDERVAGLHAVDGGNPALLRVSKLLRCSGCTRLVKLRVVQEFFDLL